jgi:ceramide glucosyltransferase
VLAIHLVNAVVAALLSAGATFGIVYTLLACVLMGRFFARSTPEPTSFPPVTVLKPLHGEERALLDNLESFCRQNYPGPVQFLFGTNSAEDGALNTVEELRRLHPKADIAVVSDSRLHGSNRKVSNLLNMLPQAKHDVLVFADSDVAVDPSYLRKILGQLQQPGVALVTCVYRGRPDPGLWPRLSAMATDYQYFPGIVTGFSLGLAHPCLGQTIALQRGTLEKIGGLGQFANHLAEDHAIGDKVRRSCGQVAIPPFTISHGCVETSFKQLASHELRWSRTVRAVDPAGHLGSTLSHPFALALLAAALTGFSARSVGLAAAAFLSRLILKLWTDHLLQRRNLREVGLLPVCDLMQFGIYVSSFFLARVTWRGVRFDVSSDGLLSSVESRHRGAKFWLIRP